MTAPRPLKIICHYWILWSTIQPAWKAPNNEVKEIGKTKQLHKSPLYFNELPRALNPNKIWLWVIFFREYAKKTPFEN